MSSYNGPGLENLRKGLLDRKSPVAKRMRAIYYLRSMETLDAVNILLEALSDKENSPLLRHELAYVLGQIKNPEACAALECVLGYYFNFFIIIIFIIFSIMIDYILNYDF